MLFKNSSGCIVKHNWFERDTKEPAEEINSYLNIQDLTHTKGFVCVYLDKCKDTKDVDYPCECKDFQKDAKKPDARNLSLFQTWLKKMTP